MTGRIWLSICRVRSAPPTTTRRDRCRVAGSPYLIDGDIFVASLEIKPGVDVRFLGNYVFEVAGVLRADGSLSSPIVFQPETGSTGWQGIFFNESAPGSFLTYCRVEGSKNSAVRVINTTPRFTSNTTTGNNNKAQNPVFNPLTLELLTGSPCIDTGHPAAAFNDPAVEGVAVRPSRGTARNDMGAFGGPGAADGVGPFSGDSDLDGLPDQWEIQYFGNVGAYGPTDDPDGDLLVCADEYAHGTDPTKKDTDGDGYTDFSEIRAGSDPSDPASMPPAELSLTVEQVKLQFNTKQGEDILIQSSADLVQWTTLEQLLGTGTTVNRIYGVTNDALHFRLVRP